jgi:hypothetical protein
MFRAGGTLDCGLEKYSGTILASGKRRSNAMMIVHPKARLYSNSKRQKSIAKAYWT